MLRDPDRVGRAVVTPLVDELDERLAAAARRGIGLGPVETKAVTVRFIWITDPDGNRLQIGQPGRGTSRGLDPTGVGAGYIRA